MNPVNVAKLNRFRRLLKPETAWTPTGNGCGGEKRSVTPAHKVKRKRAHLDEAISRLEVLQ